LLAGLPQAFFVERPSHTHERGDVVGGKAGEEPVEQEQPLLREGQRSRAARRVSRDRPAARACGLVQHLAPLPPRSTRVMPPFAWPSSLSIMPLKPCRRSSPAAFIIHRFLGRRSWWRSCADGYREP